MACLWVGIDVIAQAQSGTGKTATFAVSILQSIDVCHKCTQALVLAPTRELAQQVLSYTHVVLNILQDLFSLSNLKLSSIGHFFVSSLNCTI